MKLRLWQESIVRSIFAVDPVTGLRIVQRVFLLLGRKQAKTQLCAQIGLYQLCGSGEQGQSIICAAADVDQASRLYEKALDAIAADPYLTKLCTIYSTKKEIVVKSMGNTFKVVSSEGRRQHSHNPSLVLFDELHTQPNRELWAALTGGFAARKQPLLIAITTQSNDKRSLCYEEYEYASKVKAGIITDPSYLPILYECPPENDWESEANWALAMPALGDFCNLDFIRKEFARAKEIPAEESKFRQYYLNQLVARETKFVNDLYWKACATTVDAEALKKKTVYFGLDLSNVSDITALVGVFKDGDIYKVLQWYWLPKDYAAMRQKKDNIPYLHWAKNKANNLTLTDGDVIDYDFVKARILEIAKDYKVKQIYIDPYNATQIAVQLKHLGLPVELKRQGTTTMNAPLKFLSVLLAKHQIHHGNNDVLNWMADSAVTTSDADDNIKLDKEKSRDKIDGLVALSMGLIGWMAEGRRRSVYCSKDTDVGQQPI